MVTGNGNITISSNHAVSNNGHPQWALWTTDADTAAQFSEADVDMGASATEYALVICADGTWSYPGLNGYELYMLGASGGTRLYRNGTQMGADGPAIGAGVHHVRLEHDGAGQVDVFLDGSGTPLFSRTDGTPLTTKKLGFGWKASFGGGGNVDNWEGGDLGAPPTDLVVQDAAIALAADNVVLTTEEPNIIESVGAALSASRSPSVTFSGTGPIENDIVVLFCSSTTTATITIPSGWDNALGGTTDVESDSHQMCCVYHVVTAGEDSANTVTFTATNLYDASETGEVVGVIVRLVNPSAPIDSANSTFDSANGATPHILASLVGTNLSDGSRVISAVAKDSTGTYTTPAGWTALASRNANQGLAAFTRNTLTTASTNVTATNVTPSAGDEYASITIALAKVPSSTNLVVQDATLALAADNVTLTQDHTLVVADAAIAVLADNVTLGGMIVPGIWTQIEPFVVDPDDPIPGGNYGYQCIALADDGTLFVTGDYEGLWRSTDNGNTWSHHSTDGDLEAGPNWTLQIDPFDPDIMWCTAQNTGGPLKSTDGGQTWTLKAGGSPVVNNDTYCIAIDPTDGDHVLVTWHTNWSGQASSGVSESFDGGDTWTHHNADDDSWGTGHAVFFLSDSDTWFVGTQDDGFWRTDDGAATWTKVGGNDIDMTHGATQCLTKVGSTYYLATTYLGFTGRIYESTDDCQTWTDISTGLPGLYFSNVASDGIKLYTTGSFPSNPEYTSVGKCYERPISGGSWTEMTTSPVFEDPNGLQNGPRQSASNDDFVFTVNYTAGVWRLAALNLVVADATLALTADNVVLTQGHVLTVADATLALSADNVVLTQDQTLVVQDATLALEAESPSLTQVHFIELVTDAAIAVLADNVVLNQDQTLAVDDAQIGVASESPALTQDHTLVVDDAALALVADNVVLTQDQILTVDDATLALAADSPTLTQDHTLVVDDALIGLTAQSPTLGGAGNLIVEDATIGLSADSPTLTQDHFLVLSDGLLAVSAESPTLTQEHTLSVADALITLTAEEVTFTGGSTLTVADATLALSADSVVLTQVHVLLVSPADINVTADSVVLTETGLINLVVHDALLALSAEMVALFQDHFLVVHDALIALRADVVLFGIQGPGPVRYPLRAGFVGEERRAYFDMGG